MEYFIEKIISPFHKYAVFGNRVKTLSYQLSKMLPQNEPLSGLDVGCGSGDLAKNVLQLCPQVEITGVDVLVRDNTAIKVTGFDGHTLPFEDNNYDFVMLNDVLHHTDDPVRIMQECARVSRRFILIKDHICESWWDKVCLQFMDWVGNRGHGVSLPYNYLSKRDWAQLYEKSKVVCESEVNKLNLYSFPFSFIFDSTLHFVARLSIHEIK